MKKLLLILTVITLTFQSCSSSDDSNDIDDEPIIAVCNTPISLSISQITEYSAVLNWDNLNNNLDVKVEYGLTGFSSGNGSVISVSQNSINIDGLTPGTSYYFYVQAICAVDNTSTQSGVASFNTNISQFAGTCSGTFDGDDTGTWTFEISDTGEFVSGSAYSNNGNQTVATISTTIAADGSGTSTSENGTIGVFQITGNTLTGTWVNGNIGGTWSGSRE